MKNIKPKFNGVMHGNLELITAVGATVKGRHILHKVYCHRCRSMSYMTKNNINNTKLSKRRLNRCRFCKSRKLDYNKEQEVLLLYNNGNSVTSIASDYNVSRSVIYGILERYKNGN